MYLVVCCLFSVGKPLFYFFVFIFSASNPEQVQFMSEDSEDEIVVREISALDQIGPVVEHVYDVSTNLFHVKKKNHLIEELGKWAGDRCDMGEGGCGRKAA